MQAFQLEVHTVKNASPHSNLQCRGIGLGKKIGKPLHDLGFLVPGASRWSQVPVHGLGSVVRKSCSAYSSRTREMLGPKFEIVFFWYAYGQPLHPAGHA